MTETSTPAHVESLSAPHALRNGAGRVVRLGNDNYLAMGYQGNDRFYCGVHDNIPGTDGQCGPSAGPQCDSCREFTDRHRDDVLRNDEGHAVRVGNDHAFPGYRGSDKFYCGRHASIPGSDGQCGPSAGPQCQSCRRFTEAWGQFLLNQ